MKRLFGLGFIIIMFISCQQDSETGLVGQQFVLKPEIPNEVGTFDYIWKITDLPETSELILSDIQFLENESQAIFVPDVKGHFTIQVTVWKNNDKLGALVYNYDIIETTLEVTAQKQSRDDWLNETVDGAPIIVDDNNTVPDQVSDEVISKSSSPISIQEKIVVEEKPVAAIASPTVNAEANFTIQVAAESKASVAVQIVNRLIEAGYDAYLQEYITVSNRIVYRVRIGKFATLIDATQAASKITNDQGLPIWVTKYKK
jgi:hypothetical protein